MHQADVTTCFANLVSQRYHCMFLCGARGALPVVSAHGDMASALTGTAATKTESPSTLEPALAMVAWLFGDGVQSPMKLRPRLTR